MTKNEFDLPLGKHFRSWMSIHPFEAELDRNIVVQCNNVVAKHLGKELALYWNTPGNYDTISPQMCLYSSLENCTKVYMGERRSKQSRQPQYCVHDRAMESFSNDLDLGGFYGRLSEVHASSLNLCSESVILALRPMKELRLHHLDLSNNFLTSAIFESLLKLDRTNLRFLDLHLNRFTTLPAEICSAFKDALHASCLDSIKPHNPENCPLFKEHSVEKKDNTCKFCHAIISPLSSLCVACQAMYVCETCHCRIPKEAPSCSFCPIHECPDCNEFLECSNCSDAICCEYCHRLKSCDDCGDPLCEDCGHYHASSDDTYCDNCEDAYQEERRRQKKKKPRLG